MLDLVILDVWDYDGLLELLSYMNMWLKNWLVDEFELVFDYRIICYFIVLDEFFYWVFCVVVELVDDWFKFLKSFGLYIFDE